MHLVKLNSYSIGNKMLYGCIFVCWVLPLGAALVGLVSDTVHSGIVFVIGVVIIITISACYAVAIYSLKQHRMKMLDRKNAVFMMNERRAVKMVLMIITFYFVMLLPLFIEKGLYAIKALRVDVTTLAEKAKAHMFMITLFLANSNVNPIIYTSRLPAMRQYVFKLFGFNVPSRGKRTNTELQTTTLSKSFDDNLLEVGYSRSTKLL